MGEGCESPFTRFEVGERLKQWPASLSTMRRPLLAVLLLLGGLLVVLLRGRMEPQGTGHDLIRKGQDRTAMHADADLVTPRSATAERAAPQVTAPPTPAGPEDEPDPLSDGPDPGTLITGRAVFPSGDPVPGAMLRWAPVGEEFAGVRGGWGGDGRIPLKKGNVQTKDDGRFNVVVVPGLSYHFGLDRSNPLIPVGDPHAAGGTTELELVVDAILLRLEPHDREASLQSFSFVLLDGDEKEDAWRLAGTGISGWNWDRWRGFVHPSERFEIRAGGSSGPFVATFAGNGRTGPVTVKLIPDPLATSEILIRALGEPLPEGARLMVDPGVVSDGVWTIAVHEQLSPAEVLLSGLRPGSYTPKVSLKGTTEFVIPGPLAPIEVGPGDQASGVVHVKRVVADETDG